MLKQTFLALSGILFFSMTLSSAQARGLLTCEQEINEANTLLMKRGSNRINEVSELAYILRVINDSGSLPSNYITTDKAKRLGWSGSESESFWGRNKKTNNFLLGGDHYSNAALPAGVRWLTADIDGHKGYPSPHQLIYSPNSPRRFITTNMRLFVELDPCK
jgi:hypothetical protein